MGKYAIKGAPWIIRGAIDVSDCQTSEEVMIKAGLNYRVDKCPLVAQMEFDINQQDKILDDINAGNAFTNNGKIYRECPNSFATYRTDINIPLGNVKSKYEIVQNTDAFKFFDDAIGKDRGIWQTAGCFGRGERIFVAAKLPNNINVNGDICDDYLVFTNSHDGSGSIQILFTPLRISCQNALRAAIRQAENFVRFKHTASVHSNISTGADILGISEKLRKDAEELFIHLREIRVTDDEVRVYIANNIMSNKEIENMFATDTNLLSIFNKNGSAIDNVGISMRKVNQLVDTFDYYLQGPGQPEIRGTAWGAYNAISGYYSNVDNAIGEKRLDSILFGSKATAINNALSLALSE